MEILYLERVSLWTKGYLAICFSSFFLFMNFYTLAATLPIYVQDYLKGSRQQIGLVLTVFIIAAIILRPFAGRWADSFGNNKIVILSLVLFCAFSMLYFGIHSLLLLLMLRALHGGSYGMAATATMAVAVDLVPEKRKGEGIGYFSMFMSFAMVIGPFIGLIVMEHLGFKVLLAMCCLFSLVSLLCGISARMPKNTPRPEEIKRKGIHLSQLIETKAIPISLAGLILAFSYSSLTAFISVYAIEINLGNAVAYFFVCFAFMIVLPRPVIGKILDRFGEDVLAYPGVLLFVIGMILLSQAHSTVIFLLSGAVIGLGHGALIPCFQTLAIHSAPSHRRGLATATFFLFFDLGYGLGSYFLGVIAEHTHYNTMYLISGILVSLSALIYYILHHRKRAKVVNQ